MPQDGYGSVSAPVERIERATEYKPTDVTWGDVLVAGAERLNDAMDSDMGRASGPFDAHAEISVSVPDEDLARIRDDVADAVDDAGTLDARIVDMDATERQRLAEAIAEVLGA